MIVFDIARVCHETHRALCEAFGDHSQLPWKEAPMPVRQSVMRGVEHALRNLDGPVSGPHDAWAADKRAQGWVHGPVEDAAAKTHPRLVPFDQLPPEQQAKDFLFKAVVRVLSSRR